MSARSKARKRAIDMLYAADVRKEDLAVIVDAEQLRSRLEPDRFASWDYAKKIVTGVAENGFEIDDLIEKYSVDWSLTRLPFVDRAILRMAIWEIVFNEDIPNSVAISEAVTAAKLLSTDDSARFINGLLGKIARTLSP